jgi:hypothetical protein
LGFSEPLPGGKHHYVVGHGGHIVLPSNREYSVEQLRMLLRQVEGVMGRRVTLREWLSLL